MTHHNFNGKQPVSSKIPLKVDQFKISLSSRDSISIGYQFGQSKRMKRMRAAYKPMTS